MVRYGAVVQYSIAQYGRIWIWYDMGLAVSLNFGGVAKRVLGLL